MRDVQRNRFEETITLATSCEALGSASPGATYRRSEFQRFLADKSPIVVELVAQADVKHARRLPDRQIFVSRPFEDERHSSFPSAWRCTIAR
jgi:hypothetical protein